MTGCTGKVYTIPGAEDTDITGAYGFIEGDEDVGAEGGSADADGDGGEVLNGFRESMGALKASTFLSPITSTGFSTGANSTPLSLMLLVPSTSVPVSLSL